MKKFVLMVLSLLSLLSCATEYDDSAILEQLQQHENRLAELEKTCSQMNTNLTSLQRLLEEVKNQDYVTSVTPVQEGDVEIGYTITFHKGDPITIYHGRKGDKGEQGEAGKPGDPGQTPQVSLRKDTDGRYYWTLGDQWLLDDKGQKVCANGVNGADGSDGLTPELKIENGEWMVRYGDGQWQKLGVTGGEVVSGDNVFKEVKVGTTEVTFVLTSGESFVLPLRNIRLTISFEDHAIGIRPGETREVAYALEGASEGTMVKALAQNGWKVKVKASSFDKGTLTVTAPDPFVEDEIIVLVFDGERTTIMSAVDFVAGTIKASIPQVEVGAAAGTFTLALESNLEYTVSIPEADRSWLEQVLVKSMKTETLEFAYKENTGAARKTQVLLKDAEGKLLLTVPVEQKAADVKPEPPVPPVGEEDWTLIKYDYDLKAGDVVCFAVPAEGKAMGGLHPGKTYFDPVTVTCTGNKLTGTGMTEFTVGGTSDAWTFTASEGPLVASGAKELVFGNEPTAWRIKFDVEGVADINCNYGDIMYNVGAPRFTVYNTAASASMLNVGIYKKNWSAPVEGNRHPEVDFGELSVSSITAGAATLTQQFSNASAVPVKVGFQYSADQEAFKSGAELDYIEAPAVSAVQGTFSAYPHAFAPNTTYYVRSYIKLYGTGDYATENRTFNSKIVTFKTLAGAQPDPDQPGGGDQEGGKGANAHGHLVNYEIPHADVNVPQGQQYSSTVNEKHGSTKAYIYDTQASGQRIVTHTFMNNSKVHRNYTFLYDYEKKLPLWLAYPMNRGYCGAGGSRTNAWGYDPAVPQEHQPDLKSSYGSGYNRGHMLASHARAAITDANRQAFYYTNMTPQDAANLNTGGCSWNNLEDHEMDILPSGRDTLYVVTGCTFSEPVKWITSNRGDRCAVPKECYKCFMMCSFDTSGKMTSAKGIGYLMPNDKNGRNPYSTFAKTIDEIEALTGFDFFANVPKELQDKAESVKTVL